MSTISIRPNAGIPSTVPQFRATIDDRESLGTTPGAALDALAAQLDPSTSQRMVVVIEPFVDGALAPEQQRRLDELKKQYRLATTGQGHMSPAEHEEMELLFDAQFAAAERRAVAMAGAPHA